MSVTLPVPTDDPAKVRDLADRILKRPEFQPPRRGVLEAAWHWLSTELGNVLSRLFGGSGGISGWLAVLVVAVVAVVVIVLVGLTVRNRGAGSSGPRRPVVVLAGRGPNRSAAEWRREAALNEAAGRWRDALRCRYRALVADLAGRGVVEEVPGRTSGEYRLDVGAVAPAAGPDFDGATDLFEQAWYGDRPTGPADQAAFDELSERVLARTGRGSR